jgi:hypothetical protein
MLRWMMRPEGEGVNCRSSVLPFHTSICTIRQTNYASFRNLIEFVGPSRSEIASIATVKEKNKAEEKN